MTTPDKKPRTPSRVTLKTRAFRRVEELQAKLRRKESRFDELRARHDEETAELVEALDLARKALAEFDEPVQGDA